MHPAFSIIFFTTLSGAGYGLWFWLGFLALINAPLSRITGLIALILGFVLVVSGLCCSVLHLGQPRRAWRALSQWRSSWLAREGVAAVLCFAPMVWFVVELYQGKNSMAVGAALATLSISTVACTAMIYASLKPVPAWTHPLVLPIYLLFSVFTGGLLLIALASVFGFSGSPIISSVIGPAIVLSALVLCLLKWHVWRSIDRSELLANRASAVGLPPDRTITVFERPHTEANYLTKEMGFVLARRHAKRLRTIAMVLFSLVPLLCGLCVWFLPNLIQMPWLFTAALSVCAGAWIERWLFFAEAKHVVMLYY